MTRIALPISSAAPLVLAACGQVADVGAGLVGAREEPPRTMTSEDGLDVVAVGGNLYQVTPNVSGGGTVATAKLNPMFQNGALPNAADAATAVSHALTEHGCGAGGAVLDHEVDRSAGEQSWTFAGSCT
jgi:hypothetical protein